MQKTRKDNALVFFSERLISLRSEVSPPGLDEFDWAHADLSLLKWQLIPKF